MEIICFHNPDEENGYLSNWFHSDFSIDEIEFSSMEQYMMYKKAVCFSDKKIAEEILSINDVAEIKRLGRQISNYNDNIWNGKRQIIVYEGLLAKFSQNYSLKKMLKNKNEVNKYLYRHRYLEEPIEENWVMFETFMGKSYADSPKYIYEYLAKNYPGKYKFIWVLNDPKEKLPYEGIIVKRFTKKYAYYLAKSKYFVFNIRQPLWFRKREGQVFLETWHGTPLKKLALDMDRMDMGGSTDIENYHEQFRVTCKDWDYLVSQNKFSTDIFRSCFAFKDRPILQIGYPRNDILINDNSPAKIREYKEKLGLPLDKKIILYAPTWRDNEYSEKGKYKFASKLDFDKAKEKLSDEYIFIVKYHYLVSDKIDWTPYKGFVYTFDETKDIAWLYLVSDMLITDYSSVMFDYSILNRPMLFFAYDLEDYKENLRGFYFDFVNDIPGPISRDTDQLIKDIKEYNEDSWKEKYKNYHDKFNGIDDGHASQKVIDVIKKVSRQRSAEQ